MELEKILKDLFLFKPQEPTITTQIPTYSIKEKEVMRNIKNYRTKIYYMLILME